LESQKEKLREYFASHPRTPWSGHVFCHRFGSYPPDKVNQVGARWNPKEVGAIYFSLDKQTALAEGNYVISSTGLPLRPGTRRCIYEVELQLQAVIHLPVEELERGLSIRKRDLLSDDWTLSQTIGDVIDYLEFDGLIVPSARSDGKNLVIYHQQLELGWAVNLIQATEISVT
jgi:RES domain-containing protein